jgi:DNA polymerase elongation subunit (family B)
MTENNFFVQPFVHRTSTPDRYGTQDIHIYAKVIADNEDTRTRLKNGEIVETEETALFRVRDFQGWLYLELPDHSTDLTDETIKRPRTSSWVTEKEDGTFENSRDMTRLQTYLRKDMYKIGNKFVTDWDEIAPTGFHYERRHGLYNFTVHPGGLDPKTGKYRLKPKELLRITFKSEAARATFARKLTTTKEQTVNGVDRRITKCRVVKLEGLFYRFPVHESDVDVLRRLKTERNVNTCGWYKIAGAAQQEPRNKIGRANMREFTVNYNGIAPMDAEVETLTTRLRSVVRVLSFDAEVMSQSPATGQFPDATFSKAVPFMISNHMKSYGKPETRKTVVFALAPTPEDTPESLAANPNSRTVVCDDEYEMYRKWSQLILDYDPDILTGYNILGFDIPYIDKRMKMAFGGGWKNFIRMSRWKDDKEQKELPMWPNSSRLEDYQVHTEEIRWRSNAYGSQDLKTLHMEGRIVVDMMVLIMRDFKFSEYKLNAVVFELLTRGRNDIPAETVLAELHREGLSDLTIDEMREVIAKLPSGGSPAQLAVGICNQYDIPALEFLRLYKHHPYDPVQRADPYFQHTRDFRIGPVEAIVDMVRGKQKRGIASLDAVSLRRLLSDATHLASPEELAGFLAEHFRLNPTAIDDLYRCSKHDVEPAEIFAAWEEQDPAKLKIIRDYAEQDTVLPIDLFERLNGWPFFIESANIMGVDPEQLFTRGQQLRLASQLYHGGHQEGYVLSKRLAEIVEAKGAFVVTPIPGLYRRVKVFDFASLYPSIIIAYNIGHDTLVIDPSIPDEHCHVFEWDDNVADEFLLLDVDEERSKEIDSEYMHGSGDTEQMTATAADQTDGMQHIRKLPNGKWRFRFIRPEYGHVSLVASALEKLLAERRRVRAEIKKTADPTLKKILDERQKAIKVSCNSFYGFLLAQISGKYSLAEGGMSVTFTGRRLNLLIQKIVKEHFGGHTVYGDSVTGETPILIREIDDTTDENEDEGLMFDLVHGVEVDVDVDNNNNVDNVKKSIRYEKISDLCSTWAVGSDGKEYGVLDRKIQVWTERGWTDIQYVVRHHTEKDIYRVTTTHGLVDVTEDHSLLDVDSQKVAPSELLKEEDDRHLLHCNLPKHCCLDDDADADDDDDFLDIDSVNNNDEDVDLVTLAKRYFKMANATTTSDDLRKLSHSIKRLRSAHPDEYVYDLTTRNHHFAAGVGQLVVHNTDSIMVTDDCMDIAECIERGKHMADEIVRIGNLPKPLSLEFENLMDTMLAIGKKMYVAALVDMVTLRIKNAPNELYAKGIGIQRRDTNEYQRTFQRDIVHGVMATNRTLAETIDTIMAYTRKLFTWNNPVAVNRDGSEKRHLDFLEITGKVGDSQKSFMYLFAQHLHSIGRPAQKNDRIRFVASRLDPNPDYFDEDRKKGERLRFLDYLREEMAAGTNAIDFVWYLKKMITSTDQITDIAYNREFINGPIYGPDAVHVRSIPTPAPTYFITGTQPQHCCECDVVGCACLEVRQKRQHEIYVAIRQQDPKLHAAPKKQNHCWRGSFRNPLYLGKRVQIMETIWNLVRQKQCVMAQIVGLTTTIVGEDDQVHAEDYCRRRSEKLGVFAKKQHSRVRRMYLEEHPPKIYVVEDEIMAVVEKPPVTGDLKNKDVFKIVKRWRLYKDVGMAESLVFPEPKVPRGRGQKRLPAEIAIDNANEEEEDGETENPERSKLEVAPPPKKKAKTTAAVTKKTSATASKMKQTTLNFAPKERTEEKKVVSKKGKLTVVFGKTTTTVETENGVTVSTTVVEE